MATKVFTSKQFISRLEWLVNDVPTKYYSGVNWSKWNGKSWNMDCNCSIKSILWGFTADRSKTRGGVVYLSNGVADFTTFGGLKYCTDVSTNFSNLVPGEYLCMSNTSHAGVYIGNGKVYECTSAWLGKCMITDIDKNGNRSYKGRKNKYKWTHHGKLIWIDYSDQIIAQPQKRELVKELQHVLNQQYNCGLEEDNKFGSATSTQCSKHNLYKGIKATIIVKWVQKRLIELGYSCGKCGADGHFGNDTLKAVKAFQKAKHLAVDGYVGVATYKALVEN